MNSKGDRIAAHYQVTVGYNRLGRPTYTFSMKCGALVFLILASTTCSHAQTTPKNISAAQLQAIIGLHLDQAIKFRATYKEPLKSAYARQMALVGRDCQAESNQGQQPYNICMGQAGVQADKDYAIFYNNLQMLCHNQDQLTTLQEFEATWQAYKDSAMKATHSSWPDGTGASGFAGEVYLSLLRNHMLELDEIYGLNIAQ